MLPTAIAALLNASMLAPVSFGYQPFKRQANGKQIRWGMRSGKAMRVVSIVLQKINAGEQ